MSASLQSLFVGCVGLALVGPPVAAQDYPARPMRVITATSAGGTSDIFMRVVGEEIQKRWGQPLIIENCPGGGMTNRRARLRRGAE